MSDPYSYVLISALTSALVALGIELIAKPRLDARKEWILGEHRNRRRFEASLMRIAVMSATWPAYEIPPGASDEAKRRLEDEQARVLRELDEITQTLTDDLGSYAGLHVAWELAPLFGTSAQTLTAKYGFIARALALSDRPPDKRLRLLAELSVAMQEALFTRWHPVRRARALQKLPGILEMRAQGEPP